MPRDSDPPVEPQDPPYRVYSSNASRSAPKPSRAGAPLDPSGGKGGDPRLLSGGDRDGGRPYNTYRSAPRGLLARLRGEDDVELSLAEQGRGRGGRFGFGRGGPGRRHLGSRLLGGRWSWKRGLAAFFAAIVGWILLSLVLFMLNVGSSNSIPQAALNQLSPGGNMLFSANTVLILGTDQRPRTGPGSKEPGSNYNDAGSNSDTIMLWRIGGGVSRRLSIPRDTATNIDGLGVQKINAAYSAGGPALALKTIKQFTGIQINHIIIINLAAFPQFIDDVGGITIKTGRICSNISGGVANGGFTLNLRPGVHQLNGQQALILARTRENSCNPSENDLTRVRRQQEILNAVKSQLFSLHTFLHLPWVASDAPSVLRTDMGGMSLLSMFAAAEIGGSAPPTILKPTGAETLPNGGAALTVTPAAVQAAVQKLLNG
ncbi:MAG: LCP family protein [Solirubrobacteraceae bacterium]